jgi:anthranilate synthase component 1
MPAQFSYTAESFRASADMVTPVSLYANLRQLFPETLLLECVETRSPETSCSYLCADPLARFSVAQGRARVEQNGQLVREFPLDKPLQAIAAFNEWQAAVSVETSEDTEVSVLGWFGYLGFSAIPLLENITFHRPPPDAEQISDLQFALYRYVFRLDHYRDTINAIQLRQENDNARPVRQLFEEISRRRAPDFPFATQGAETTDLSDDDFAAIVETCQRHIQRGDVFQIVPSRRFTQTFSGDEFAVYRALRRINPSPFLFFFDYGGFTLFGSSPEAQLLVREGTARVMPIAGTYPRGHNPARDRELAKQLLDDPKENAEHTMLVDLARNDLSRHCYPVRVEAFKETEFYSHVIHLVSRVSGKLETGATAAQTLAATFPAGTLSGAPKHRALQLINQLEPAGRSFYGGSVGFFGLNGDSTHAIMIRSFLAKGRKLIYQAGAGIVADSDPRKETAEVNNKLAALRRAIAEAQDSRQ